MSCTRSFLFIGLFTAGLCLQAPVFAQTVSKSNAGDFSQILTDAQMLVRAGATETAAVLLSEQSPSSEESKLWKRWHQQLWYLWAESEQNKKWLASTDKALKLKLPSDVTEWVWLQHARAQFAAKNYARSESALRGLIEAGASVDTQKHARKLIMDISIDKGRFDDAVAEASLFQKQYSPQDTEWFLYRAYVSYQAGQYAAVLGQLAPLTTLKARLLQQTARLKLQPEEAVGIRGWVEKQLQRKKISASEKKHAFALLFSALQQSEGVTSSAQVDALEQYFSIEAVPLYENVLDLQPELLASTYSARADVLGNANKLLQNDTAAWVRLAAKAALPTVDQKSIWGALLQRTNLDSSAKTHDRALNAWLDLSLMAKQYTLVRSFIGDKSTLSTWDGVASRPANALINWALQNDDYVLMKRMAPYLQTTPSGVSASSWQLKKARVAILTGEYASGVATLKQWVPDFAPLNGELTDAVLQPVFELQAVEKHADALAIFRQISSATASKKHRREIDYWMAQSYEALDQSELAVTWYLKSAMAQAEGGDDWGQSARFHAAKNLVSSGAYHDADKVLKQLRSESKSRARLSAIQIELQRLWLLENAQ